MNIPLLNGGNDTDVSGNRNDSNSSTNSLAWENINFIENAWEYLNETDNQTRSVIEAAWSRLNETDSQIPSFGIPIREKRSLVTSQTQIEAKPRFLARTKVKRQIGALASSLLGFARSGFVRSFLFNLLGPVLSNSKSVGHKEAAKAVAKHIIPYTGLKGHDAEGYVHQLLHEGNVSHAIQTLKNNTANFRPHNLWLDEPMPHKDSIIPHSQINSYQVYRAARKTLPYIDHILTDRLKSQSIVDFSLNTALFGDLKKSLNKRQPTLQASSNFGLWYTPCILALIYG